MKTITKKTMTLEDYFTPFREKTIGYNQYFKSPFGHKRIIYADWIASGRLYQPIEDKMMSEFAPFVGNTHTETNVCGTSMTLAYHKAREIIKHHVNAGQTDCIISYGSGMTGVINKFQRILGLKIPEKQRNNIKIKAEDRPIVFVTHMEHHSNQTSWLETICDVEVINPTDNGLVDLGHFAQLLDKYKKRKTKIAAITACSNVTGIQTPYHDMAGMIHRASGLCFVDFACSAPYVKIDMHPEGRADEYLDAIYFSPHKFLGGPGTTGILIFNAQLYDNKIPDNPGGGTVKWTNPWKEHEFIDNIEDREDGGTPPFLQTIRTALCIQLKQQMGIELMLRREEQLIDIVFHYLSKIPNVHILAEHLKHRIGAISFYIDDVHYNLGVKLLNDYYGVQVRGGCSCAGTYGHYLLEVDKQHSQSITSEIDKGNFSSRPGWIRLSLHPTMTDEEVIYICEAIEEVAQNHADWGKNYLHDIQTNEFQHLHFLDDTEDMVDSWFEL
jgi:selenocysteine lyase/cysteine desulfurase